MRLARIKCRFGNDLFSILVRAKTNTISLDGSFTFRETPGISFKTFDCIQTVNEKKQIVIEKDGEILDLQAYKSPETGILRLDEGDYVIAVSPANNEFLQPTLK